MSHNNFPFMLFHANTSTCSLNLKLQFIINPIFLPCHLQHNIFYPLYVTKELTLKFVNINVNELELDILNFYTAKIFFSSTSWLLKSH